MNHFMEFQDHNQQFEPLHHPDETGENPSPEHITGSEINLDSPCTEHCDHPEHQKHTEDFWKEKCLRTAAESENLRRRLEKEKQEGIEYALFRFSKEIIGIADQLSWAVASVATPEGQQDSLYQGVSMTLAELERVLSTFGIIKIDALNQPFNPHQHQVVQEQEHADIAPGTIVSVLQNGYMLKERLLRPAMVTVAKAVSENSAK
jgi:molecular chaperone GrpE